MPEKKRTLAFGLVKLAGEAYAGLAKRAALAEVRASVADFRADRLERTLRGEDVPGFPGGQDIGPESLVEVAEVVRDWLEALALACPHLGFAPVHARARIARVLDRMKTPVWRQVVASPVRYSDPLNRAGDERQAFTNVAELKRRLAQAEADLAAMTDERNAWRTQANDNERHAEALKSEVISQRELFDADLAGERKRTETWHRESKDWQRRAEHWQREAERAQKIASKAAADGLLVDALCRVSRMIAPSMPLEGFDAAQLAVAVPNRVESLRARLEEALARIDELDEALADARLVAKGAEAAAARGKATVCQLEAELEGVRQAHKSAAGGEAEARKDLAAEQDYVTDLRKRLRDVTSERDLAQSDEAFVALFLETLHKVGLRADGCLCPEIDPADLPCEVCALDFVNDTAVNLAARIEGLLEPSMFRCDRCHRVVHVDEGGSDDMPGACSDCWCEAHSGEGIPLLDGETGEQIGQVSPTTAETVPGFEDGLSIRYEAIERPAPAQLAKDPDELVANLADQCLRALVEIPPMAAFGGRSADPDLRWVRWIDIMQRTREHWFALNQLDLALRMLEVEDVAECDQSIGPDEAVEGKRRGSRWRLLPAASAKPVGDADDQAEDPVSGSDEAEDPTSGSHVANELGDCVEWCPACQDPRWPGNLVVSWDPATGPDAGVVQTWQAQPGRRPLLFNWQNVVFGRVEPMPMLTIFADDGLPVGRIFAVGADGSCSTLDVDVEGD